MRIIIFHMIPDWFLQRISQDCKAKFKRPISFLYLQSLMVDRKSFTAVSLEQSGFTIMFIYLFIVTIIIVIISKCYLYFWSKTHIPRYRPHGNYYIGGESWSAEE